MKIVSLEAYLIDLPFRFSFKHSLASRSNSQNLIVKAVIADGARVSAGYGEGVPRDYVTGESVHDCLSGVVNEFIPRLVGRTFADNSQLLSLLKSEWLQAGLDRKARGAAWCALELAVLDAAARNANLTVAQLLSGQRQTITDIVYGAVIPFAGPKALNAVLWFYKAFGFKTVKIKVGSDLEFDLFKLRKARQILGPSVKLRVDANCAWSAQQTIQAAEKMRAFAVSSYEQPVPADDLEGLAYVTANIPELVMADESLCTVSDAHHLAEKGIVSAFNIRLSKVGGILAAREIAAVAKQAKIKCQMGAQVGESGILSAAGRSFASLFPDFENYEGSNNFFLLRQDITAENLNVGWGGKGRVLQKAGLGITVIPERLERVKISHGQKDESQRLVCQSIE